MKSFLLEAQALLANEPKLTPVNGFKRAVFVGDTHGDLEATEILVERYLNDDTALVFVGDYVDRGPHSQENIDTLLKLKLKHPKQVILLQGNHEGWKISPFYPADFWESLSTSQQEIYAKVLAKLPLVAVLPNGVIALHGALPAVESLDQINKIELGDDRWLQITWGDWVDLPGHFLGHLGSRPQFGKDRFETLMERFGMRLLIRGHQPDAPLRLFDDSCLTIFTSSAYERQRVVAVVELDKKIKSAQDVLIKKI